MEMHAICFEVAWYTWLYTTPALSSLAPCWRPGLLKFLCAFRSPGSLAWLEIQFIYPGVGLGLCVSESFLVMLIVSVPRCAFWVARLLKFDPWKYNLLRTLYGKHFPCLHILYLYKKKLLGYFLYFLILLFLFSFICALLKLFSSFCFLWV